VNDITRALRGMEACEPGAADQLLALVYEELRRIAGKKMGVGATGHTLQPTALVHEAWLRLGGDVQPAWQNRAHFFGAAAEAMRRVLIDRARRRSALRRGGGQEREDLDGFEIAMPSADDEQILAVDEALTKLAALNRQHADLVKLRYFAGLTIEEAAETLGISKATAKRWWAYSRAWLHTELRSGV
jgi:RNA polymerase sigma factor (TIGR02999 family)